MHKQYWKVIKFVLGLLIFVSCQPAQPMSSTEHQERDYSTSEPSFLWQAVTESSLASFINKKFGYSNKSDRIDAQNSLLTKRLQEISDHLDSNAREFNPVQMAKIPRPVIAVIKDKTENAATHSLELCIKQKKLDHPQNIYKNCDVILDSKDSTWDPEYFTKLYNSMLSLEFQRCKLIVKDEVIVAPLDPTCSDNRIEERNSESNNLESEIIQFFAQSNVITFSTDFLNEISEATVLFIMAHELAHYYKGHSGQYTYFAPYFFLQTPANELQRPIKTLEYLDIQQALNDRLMLNRLGAFTIEGSKFNKYLLHYLLLTTRKVMYFCRYNTEIIRACAKPAKKIFDLYDDEFDYSKIIYTTSQSEYLQFEKIFTEFLSTVTPQDLDSNTIEEITYELNFNYSPLKKHFSEIRDANSLLEWFESANLLILEDILMLEEAFQKAKDLGLGIYTTEEEADEIGLELAVRAGFTKQQLMDSSIEMMKFHKGTEITMRQCLAARANNWKFKNIEKIEYFLLGNRDPHHSECYRLFNKEREWDAHNMDQFLPASGLVLDEVAWKEAVKKSL